MSTCLTKPAKIFTFLSVEVYIVPGNQKIIEWRLNPHFRFKALPIVFFVEWARAGGEWTRLNPDNPVDSCLYLDENNYRCSVVNDVYYRVVAYDGVDEYNSKPAHTFGVLDAESWLIARDIIRKEYLRLKKYVGTPGYILKKRNHGPRCDACADFDTEEIIDTTCEDCFGTGFLQGYYDAIPYYFDLTGVTSTKDVALPFSVVDDKARQARGVAYPRLDTYDLWVTADSNRRFILRRVAEVVALRGVPLVYQVEMRRVPATSPVYQVPLYQPLLPDQDPAIVSESGWRDGIDYMQPWE